MSTPLTKYKVLAIEVSSQDPNSDKEILEQLAGSINVRIQKLKVFEKVYCTLATVESNYDLKLLVTLNKYREISVGERVLFGALLGQSTINGKIQLIDAKSNQVIASADLKGTTSGGSIFSGGTSTSSQAAERIAEQVVIFISENSRN